MALNTRPEEMSSFSPMIDILAAVHVDAHVRLFMN
jgi:urease accessory protein